MADTARLAQLFLLALAGKTEGERLAALAAFERSREAAGLNLHDIADMFRPGRPPEAPPPTASEEARTDAREINLTFDGAQSLAREFSDDDWPEIADWLVEADENWYAAHQRYLLDGQQRAFVDEMRENTKIVRPTLRQAAWLLILADKVATQLTRPEGMPAHRVGHAPPPPDRPKREVPAMHRRPVPKRITSREDQLKWIAAITSARRQAPQPKDDPMQPALFSDAEVRALTWYASTYEAWLIDRSYKGKSDVLVSNPPSGEEIARKAHVSLRTVRRAVGKARSGGYLEVERAGRGRGRPTLHKLTLPPDGWRHDSIPVCQPRRRAGRNVTHMAPVARG